MAIIGSDYKEYMEKLAGVDAYTSVDTVSMELVPVNPVRVTVDMKQGLLRTTKNFVLEVPASSALETEILKAIESLIKPTVEEPKA